MANTRPFTDVRLTAEQVTEPHRTLEADHTVTEVELPGSVHVYIEIDGGRLLLTTFKAGTVLDAIDTAAAAQKQADATAETPAEPQANTPQG